MYRECVYSLRHTNALEVCYQEGYLAEGEFNDLKYVVEHDIDALKLLSLIHI